jgi:hypothetical protein
MGAAWSGASVAVIATNGKWGVEQGGPLNPESARVRRRNVMRSQKRC